MSLPTADISEQIIAFADIQGYHRRICAQLNPEQIFNFLNEYYAIAQEVMDPSEGKIIKFIGDSILITFPSTVAQPAIDVLRKLKNETDGFLARKQFDSRLCIRANVGPVASGILGSGESARFDICGLSVNETALLPPGEWVLSEKLLEKI